LNDRLVVSHHIHQRHKAVVQHLEFFPAETVDGSGIGGHCEKQNGEWGVECGMKGSSSRLACDATSVTDLFLFRKKLFKEFCQLRRVVLFRELFDSRGWDF